MSLSRFLLPLVSPPTAASKFASSAATSALRSCSQTPRTFSSTACVGLSSKRELQTAAAYRPYTLDPPPAPPRNSGIPDTSIAGGIPELNETRPPELAGQREASPGTPSQEKTTFSVTENEAQKSKPVITSTSSALSQSTSPSAPKHKRSKLRPRKAAMSLTSSATKQLRNLLSQPEPKLIRVGVKNRGCSGLAYNLEYVDKPGVFDETVEQDGVKVLIDSKALFSIIGSEMDWVEDKLNQRFVFRNPNIRAMWLWRVIHGIDVRYGAATEALLLALFSIGTGAHGFCGISSILAGRDQNLPLIFPTINEAEAEKLKLAVHQYTPGSKSTIRTFCIIPSRLFTNAR
ncbi:MAG: Iron-sulfur assembly protein 1 [Pleopsidium flavum]|nr:MAG: Iron-sulfur assembly protein 1 [Pleopsidium flavum]